MKKRRRYKKKKIIWLLLFFISLFTFLGSVTYQYFKSIKQNEEIKTQEKVNKESKKVDKLSMVMVGDNLIHDKIYQYAKNGETYDFRPIFAKVKPIISQYDIAYYNQETILGGKELGVSSYPAFNSPQEVGEAMIDTGFNLVSLSTNHTMDRGEQAILASRKYWDSKRDVLAVGSYSSFEDRDKVRIVTKNNIRYTMLNYTYGTNGISVPSGKEYLVNVWPITGNNPDTDKAYQDYKNQVKKDIEQVRDKVDLLIVAMHWGVEYQDMPNRYQEDMASYLSRLGVNIIIGTHPHVIQPVTWINQTLVIYSLGNFLSAHEVVNLSNRVGLMSMVDIYKENDKIILKNLRNELLYTYYTSSYQDFEIIPFSSMEEKYLSNYREVYSKYREIVQSLDKEVMVNSID